jgi:hypothetical protein
VHDPAVIPARLTDEDHRCCADRHQHQETRRKQQDLSDGAPTAGLRSPNDLEKRNVENPRENSPTERTRIPPLGSIAFRDFLVRLLLGGRLAGQILLEPVNMVVAVDDIGLPHQRPEQRQRGFDAIDNHLVQRAT